MTNTEAYKIIGERAQELANIPEVQAKMVEMVRNGATKEDAEKFFTSITSWYGAGLDRKSALKIDASKKNMYAILFNLSERYGNNMVDIDVLTWEEYKSLINSKK